MPKYRTHFELDLEDIDRIQDSLTQRVGDLTRQIIDPETGLAANDDGQQSPDEMMEEVQALRGLLGKLHDQKIWFDPKEYQPRG